MTSKSAGKGVDVASQDPDRRRKTRGLTTPGMQGGNFGPLTRQDPDPEKKNRSLTTPRMRGGNVGPVTRQDPDPEKKMGGLENM